MEAQPFEYASQPQAVSSKRKGGAAKYRPEDENDLALSNNIMFDRRVVRGNTYAAQVVTQNATREMERLRMENERAMKREVARRKMEAGMAPRTPPPVVGRSHMDVQTDTYLEELTDRPVEVNADTQTEDTAEVFDFDVEVTPILEVLVGKTLQTSMLEVMEEEELAAIRKRQDEFEQMRNAELMEVQRLEAEASRKFAEKQRRLKQELERKKLQQQLKQKVAARSFAKVYLAELNASVFSTLEQEGKFYDPVKKEVEDAFMPWLMDGVVAESQKVQTAQKLADDLLDTALEKAITMQQEALEAYKAKVAAEAEAKRKAEEEAAAAAAAAAEAAEAGEGEGEGDE
jgi:hypothetical protein